MAIKDQLAGRNHRAGWLVASSSLVGALVAVALGVYGRTHTPTGHPLALIIGFSGMAPMKAWLTTAAVVLAAVQLVSALWMWGCLPGCGTAPFWIVHAHRWSGTLAFLVTLPVAYHCLWSIGFYDYNMRVYVHSAAGCFFYGVFASKMLALRLRGIPGWFLPWAGGLLFVFILVLWITASVWYFSQPGLPLI
ncbi:DUF6529 family protein [Streptomyces chartreusis]|uniref:DUF6529 family protein n=1 Tax=Streptomyces chartreusis TaxID=1969 RepID=UPI003818F831